VDVALCKTVLKYLSVIPTLISDLFIIIRSQMYVQRLTNPWCQVGRATEFFYGMLHIFSIIIQKVCLVNCLKFPSVC
jgi:hypothetical protein